MKRLFLFLLVGLSACYQQSVTPTAEVGAPVGVILQGSMAEYGWTEFPTEGMGYSTVSINGRQVTFYENWQPDQPLETILNEMVLRGAKYVFLPSDTPAITNVDVFFKVFTGREAVESFLQTLPASPSTPAASEESNNFDVPLIFCLTIGIIGLILFLALKAVEGTSASSKTKGKRVSPDGMIWRETLDARKTASEYKTDYSVKGKRKPIVQQMFTYVYGNDRFEESIAVEDPDSDSLLGEFLGEVGLSIAHTYSPRQPWDVAAFELWIFDVKTISSISHVFISEHVAATPELRAKIEGQAVTLAALDAVASIEGKTFLVEARVLDMAYRQQPDLPDNCAFQHFTLEVTAWRKVDEAFFAA